MKLQDLPIGARFEYKGQVFVKTGPLTAVSEEGGQQVIPRSAMLKPRDGPMAETKGKGGELDEARVLVAFADFHQACSKLLDVSARPQLEAARLKFLRALK